MISVVVFFVLLLISVLPLLCSAQTVNPYITILLGNGDTIHAQILTMHNTLDTAGNTGSVMSAVRATNSIDAINASIASKLATAAFTVAAVSALYGYTPANGANYKSITDSGTCLTCYTTGYDLKKSKDSVVALIPSIAGLVATTRTISTTSPLTGGGDLSANRTFAINNAAADGSTKGAASFATEYFDDNGSGNINLAFVNGTGSVSANAVTINATKGTITYTSPSISAGNAITVTFTNSYITSTSNVNLILNSNGANLATNVQVYMKSKSSGSCTFNVANLSLLSLFNSTFLIDFTVIN